MPIAPGQRRRTLRGIAIAAVLLASGCSFEGPPVDPYRPEYREWRTYLGDKAVTHYSSLDQIHVGNVHRLEVAWTLSTGDLTNRRSEIQCNPIIVEATLYCTTAQGRLFAANAETGDLLWVYDPFARMGFGGPGTNRGVAYWEDETGTDRRIFFGAANTIHAVDATTGQPIVSWGNNGMVDLREGLGRDVGDLYVVANAPGIVYRDLLIQGTRVGETLPAAPGHIRAYDVRTGEIVWTFHTIPHPGEYGYETWPPDAYTYMGGANNWAGMSLDEERGIVYVPTGSAAFDFYGGNRKGANLFANTLLALDAATGRRIWHFQVVHHDIWDYDLPAPPNLVTIRRRGRTINAVAQITKTGHVFVFDRETGEPVFPIEEVPVPPSDLPGEEAWPTQPIPVAPPPFTRVNFTEDLIARVSPESHAQLLQRFRQSRAEGIFTPPSARGTVVFPGFNGGGEWGGAAFDPVTGILYVNATEMPWLLTMVGVPPEGGSTADRGRRVYTLNCASCHGADRAGDASGTFPSLQGLNERYSADEVAAIIASGRGFMPSFSHIDADDRAALVAYLMDPARANAEGEGEVTSGVDVEDPNRTAYIHTGWHRWLGPEGYPAIEPPWGTLTAIDLNTGEHVWQVPLGDFEELDLAGHEITGAENYGGPIVTAGGLVFVASTHDAKFRAFDKRTGELLWEYQLPAAGYATPATYEINGKQYIVIAAGGGKTSGRSSDTYIAFALPD